MLAIFGILAVYPYAAGYIAVSSACKADGGTRIYEKVSAVGYLDDSGYSICVGCIEDLGAGRFEFVDHYVGNAYTNELASEPGVNRYVIQPISDKACDPWRKSSRWMRDGRSYGIDEDECVALLPTKEPSRYLFRMNQSSRLTLFGLTMDITDYDIMDTEESMLLARHRIYGHTPIFQYAFERSGPFWSCDESRQNFRASRFREEVLLNTGID